MLAIASLVVSILLPIWEYQDPVSGEKHALYPIYYMTKSVSQDGEVRTGIYFPYCLTAILIVAAATIAVMEIRRFDNRITQIKMGTLNTLILLCVMISAVYFSNRLSSQFNYGWKYGPGIWAVFAGVAFNWLALRFIRRDEKMVRDSDRIR